VKKFFKFALRALLIYWGFNMLIGLIKYLNRPPVKDCIEYSQIDTLSHDFFHQRSWNVYGSSQQECMGFNTQKVDHDLSLSQRNDFPYPTYRKDSYASYWGKVYHRLSSMESTALTNIHDSLTHLIIQNEYDHIQTAEMVVSMIQDIPYSLIKTDECLSEDVQPCLGNEKFGLLSPSEFMYELHGDCDTRAVLLYKLLSSLGYDTIIVVSREYGHAMIAINLPTSGDYIEYQGVPYYFWETTAKGWRVGMLPPSYPEVDYWHIALGPQNI
jgi:hypothetical protein